MGSGVHHPHRGLSIAASPTSAASCLPQTQERLSGRDAPAVWSEATELDDQYCSLAAFSSTTANRAALLLALTSSGPRSRSHNPSPGSRRSLRWPICKSSAETATSKNAARFAVVELKAASEQY